VKYGQHIQRKEGIIIVTITIIRVIIFIINFTESQNVRGWKGPLGII